MTAFGHEKVGTQKNLKTIFFQNKFYSLKAHAHYFFVLIYLSTWRTAKLGVFTHFTITNLPQCSQSINSLIYVYSIQIPSCFFMSAWSQAWSHFFVLPLPAPPPQKKKKKNSCIIRTVPQNKKIPVRAHNISKSVLSNFH